MNRIDFKSGMKLINCLLLFLLPVSGVGQGLVFNDQAYSSQPLQPGGLSGSKSERGFALKVDLKPYCPEVKEQGDISSCVGWSLGYAAMTIEKAVEEGWKEQPDLINEHAFSPMFLYNQIKLGDCKFGAELSSAFQFLEKRGNVKHHDFKVLNNCDSLPSPTLAEKGKLNTIAEFHTLFTPDEKDELKIQRVKANLNEQKPVVIGMLVLENFLDMKSDEDTWYPSIGNTHIFGGHAMVVVGYDETRQAFEVMNSWGETWANNGFAWIRYDDFAKYCKYAYRFSLHPADSDFLEGSIVVKQPVMQTAEQEVYFTHLPFHHGYGIYRLGQTDDVLPLRFQIEASGFRKGSYLYVIGLDDNGEPTILWPGEVAVDPESRKAHQNARVTSSYLPAVMPDSYNVYAISAPRKEYLCIINATEPLYYLPQTLRSLRLNRKNFSRRLQQGFATRMVSTDDVVMEKDRISFFSELKPGKNMALILLELDTQSYISDSSIKE